MKSSSIQYYIIRCNTQAKQRHTSEISNVHGKEWSFFSSKFQRIRHVCVRCAALHATVDNDRCFNIISFFVSLSVFSLVCRLNDHFYILLLMRPAAATTAAVIVVADVVVSPKRSTTLLECSWVIFYDKLQNHVEKEKRYLRINTYETYERSYEKT